jgi:hypothetical protein
VNEVGTRSTVFTVTGRSSTTISGTFEVTTVSGYLITEDIDVVVWRVMPTKAFGTWSASLVVGPRPATQMNGYDFCVVNNVGQLQMINNGTNFFMVPGPGGVGIPGGCQFN